MARCCGAIAVVWVAVVLACGVSGATTPVAPTTEPDEPVVADDANVVGVVEGPNGTPAADAVVAINGVNSESLAIVRVDANGRFRARRPKERFAITATSALGMAAFVAPADAASKATLRIRLSDATEAFTILGSLSVPSGTLPTDTFVLAARSSPDEGDIFKTLVSESGAFTLQVPPGSYSLRPSSESLLARWAVTKGVAGGREKVNIEASLRAPAPESVVRWLSDGAMPIGTTEVRSATDDIAALAGVLGSARVVGVGEATHGTREYFRLKHRLLKRLVTHHDLTLLAMEANFSDAERIDAWVRSGHGTVEDAMKSLFVVWRTEEIRALLLWMREWNADPRHKRKIGFRGYDVQGARASIVALRAYLQRVDPAAENELLAPLAPLVDGKANDRGMIELGDAEATTTRDAIARVAERLVSSRRGYVARSSAAEYSLMMQHARAMEQARTRFAAKGNAAQFAARDLAMAQNVVWLSEQLPKEERMMVWAHNGHIQVDASTLPGKNMGTHLRQWPGSDYLATGFVLDTGTYRAWVKPTEPVIADVAVGPHEPGWVAEAFARAGPPVFAIDLRTATAGPARDWLFAPHVVHSCGWLVSEREPKGTIDVLGRLFDVAIYVKHTTSARQLPRR